MSDRFEHANRAKYYYSGQSKAQNGKIYEILDRKTSGVYEKFKIEPGWYSRSSFRPYYDVTEGDILIATANVYIGLNVRVQLGNEYEIFSVRNGYRYEQVIKIAIGDMSYRARHQFFKPGKRTLGQKVELI